MRFQLPRRRPGPKPAIAKSARQTRAPLSGCRGNVIPVRGSWRCRVAAQAITCGFVLLSLLTGLFGLEFSDPIRLGICAAKVVRPGPGEMKMTVRDIDASVGYCM